MINSEWLESARAIAPALFAQLDANLVSADWSYIRMQILALQVNGHLHPLELFSTLQDSEKSAIDTRQSAMGCFSAGKLDLKQITFIGKSQGNIWFGENARAHNILINSEAGYASIVFGPNIDLNECVIQFLSPQTSLIITSGTTMARGTNLLIQESGNYILIGDDTMWSNDVAVRTSDSHGVYDTGTRNRMNHGRPVVVHRHVWVGRHASLNRGTEIGADAVVGQYCVTGSTMRGSTSFLGNPAMPGSRRITWDRTMANTIDETEVINPSRTRQINHLRTCADIEKLSLQSTSGLSEINLLSRVLAADFPSDYANPMGELCWEAQRLRIWAVEQMRSGVNLPYESR